ncbi:hypothetical protein QFZ24_002419 [Streptomyces phaeochromogenes]|nr:hypothetical protein [Streptomyces phaeochromogenes]
MPRTLAPEGAFGRRTAEGSWRCSDATAPGTGLLHRE